MTNEHQLTSAVHVTAARVRFGMNVKGYDGAAARDGMVWTPPRKVSVKTTYS
jgi:hypothetical protein